MSENTNRKSIYEEIAMRSGGDVYVGVVGPVRTGKSTFIKRFMECAVMPNMEEGIAKERARDELPQSAGGKTVMTTEPKFIPEDAVPISLENGGKVRVRLIDCVGYLIPDAMGVIEEGQPRMVRTPWQEDPMPFSQAAELGTQKVITEHSNIGIVVTTDGTVGDIPREAYTEAEERVITECKALGKPFAIVLNSAMPQSDRAQTLGLELEAKYGVPVALVNCLDLNTEDIRHILGMILEEFPVSEISLKLPEWTDALEDHHPMKQSIRQSIAKCAGKVDKMGDLLPCFSAMNENEYISDTVLDEKDMGTGKVCIRLCLEPSLYYRTVSELTGVSVESEKQLIQTLKELAQTRKKYDKVAEALNQVNATGYGIVMPDVEDLKLEDPKIVKQSGGYGVKLCASAQSIHMIRANIETEIHPTVGTEQQSEDMVKYLLKEFETDPKSIWESNLFGKSLYQLINEGLHTKLEHMPEESRKKLSGTLERIINEGSNGLICILL